MGGEEGGGSHGAPADVLAPPAHVAPSGHHDGNRPADITITKRDTTLADLYSPLTNREMGPNPFSRRNTSLDLDGYFKGPRDTQKHSKWPIFLQMHGSILPKMTVPLLCIGGWATAMTCIHELVTPIGISSILLTVLGFVVGLGLSFRSSTAYERYNEGRRYWAQLVLTSQNLARVFWIHATEREGELGKKDLLAKLTALNLIVAFGAALKHRLRFEPYTCYDDVQHLVAHLDTFARVATKDHDEKWKKTQLPAEPGFFKGIGEYLGVSFAESNPRKAVKKAQDPLGNLPLEIISYLAGFADELVANGQLPVPMQQTICYNNLVALNDVLTGTERVLSTPLPIAYAIAIAQITWVYVLLLPFQLLLQLGWITIPATVAAAYIILGILFIGREIENPFGTDVNDLPLDVFCANIAADMDVIASRRKASNNSWVETSENKPLWPLYSYNWKQCMEFEEDRIRDALKHKVHDAFQRASAQTTATEHHYLHHEKAEPRRKVTVEEV